MQQCKFPRLSLLEPVLEFPKLRDAIIHPSCYYLELGRPGGIAFGLDPNQFLHVYVRTAATFLVSMVWGVLVALVGAHQVVSSLVHELSRLQDAQM